jgi:hypothetical protein
VVTLFGEACYSSTLGDPVASGVTPIRLVGRLNEHLVLPDRTDEVISIDLIEVKTISSIALRTFVRFFERNKDKRIELRGCPEVLVRTSELVPEFKEVMRTVLVTSLALRFDCSECAKEIMFELPPVESSLVTNALCDRCEGPLALCGDDGLYRSFISSRG